MNNDLKYIIISMLLFLSILICLYNSYHLNNKKQNLDKKHKPDKNFEKKSEENSKKIKFSTTDKYDRTKIKNTNTCNKSEIKSLEKENLKPNDNKDKVSSLEKENSKSNDKTKKEEINEVENNNKTNFRIINKYNKNQITSVERIDPNLIDSIRKEIHKRKFSTTSSYSNSYTPQNIYSKPKTYAPKVYTREEYLGKCGENLLISELKYFVPGAIILRNLYIPSGYNRTSEIDVLLLHETGIYCFECKNYSGGIFGSEDNDYWTEYFYPSKKSFKLFNPIKQNRIHIKNLRKIKEFSSLKIFNCVVFTKNGKIPNIELDSDEGFFCNLKDLPSNIRRLMYTNKYIYSREDLSNLEDILQMYTDAPESIKNKHIEDIERFKESKNFYN